MVRAHALLAFLTYLELGSLLPNQTRQFHTIALCLYPDDLKQNAQK